MSQNKNDLLQSFFLMEKECTLFNLDENNLYPVWDILRLHIYLKYYYPPEQLKKLYVVPKRKVSDYFYLIKDLFASAFYFLTKRGDDMFFTASRGVTKSALYYDKSAIDLINLIGDGCFIVETNTKSERKVYQSFSGFTGVYKKIIKTNNLSKQNFAIIQASLNNFLGTCLVEYSELNDIYRQFQTDYKYYKLLFKIKKTKRIFISRGNEKGICLAAKNLGIACFELQHAAIEKDNILYAYPDFITPDDRIVFPETLLTYGEYWGSGMNIPAKIIPIGNDYLYNNSNAESDNSVLIVSTIIHGAELSTLTVKMAVGNPNIRFIYKLHINEYRLYEHYQQLFKNITNISIVSNEIDINTLVARCQLVVLIISTVLYEAINNNKKVAVYKKLNYYAQKDTFSLPNVYLFDNWQELLPIVNMPVKQCAGNFFKPFDKNLVNKVLNGR